MAAQGAKPSGLAATSWARCRSTWRSAKPRMTGARSPCPSRARRTPSCSARSPPRSGPRCRARAPAAPRRASSSTSVPRLALLAFLAVLALLASATASRADPDALWKIISEKCLPNEREYGQPAPCALVDIDQGVDKGYVVLKDIVGDTQYLVMPTAKITGIEDPAVLAPGATNYFAAAWSARHYTVDVAKAALPRDGLSLAINSQYGRTQNQLHIH